MVIWSNGSLVYYPEYVHKYCNGSRIWKAIYGSAHGNADVCCVSGLLYRISRIMGLVREVFLTIIPFVFGCQYFWIGRIRRNRAHWRKLLSFVAFFRSSFLVFCRIFSLVFFWFFVDFFRWIYHKKILISSNKYLKNVSLIFSSFVFITGHYSLSFSIKPFSLF